MTLFFTPDQIQIYRLRRIGSTDRIAYSATYTVYEADIQPLSPERTQLVSGQLGSTFQAFVDVDVEVKESDELRIVGQDDIYSVKGVSRWQGAGLLDHIELILVKKDDNG